MKTYPRSQAPAGAAIAEVAPCVLEGGIAEVAATVLSTASMELGLEAVPRSIRWFVVDPAQTLLGNDCVKGYANYPASLAELSQIRGFTDATYGEHLAIWVRLEDDPSQVAMVVAHELRHSWQTRECGGGPVNASDRAEREADAQAYAAGFLTRMGLSCGPAAAEQTPQQAWRQVTQFAG
jgi:hypothetical protein